MKKSIILILAIVYAITLLAQNSTDSLTLTISGENYKQLETYFTHKERQRKQQTDWAKFYRYSHKNDSVIQPLKAVFMGNSITDAWAKKRPDFFSKNNFVGRGISGQTSSEMLIRFQSDVIDLHPKYVVILAGTNDVARNNGIISHKHIVQNVKSMCELAKFNKIKPVICSILPANRFNWNKELKPADDIIALNAMLKEYAQKNRFIYVDYHSEMKDASNGLPANLAKDGVHPSDEGYAIMERIILKALNMTSK